MRSAAHRAEARRGRVRAGVARSTRSPGSRAAAGPEGRPRPRRCENACRQRSRIGGPRVRRCGDGRISGDGHGRRAPPLRRAGDFRAAGRRRAAPRSCPAPMPWSCAGPSPPGTVAGRSARPRRSAQQAGAGHDEERGPRPDARAPAGHRRRAKQRRMSIRQGDEGLNMASRADGHPDPAQVAASFILARFISSRIQLGDTFAACASPTAYRNRDSVVADGRRCSGVGPAIVCSPILRPPSIR